MHDGCCAWTARRNSSACSSICGHSARCDQRVRMPGSAPPQARASMTTTAAAHSTGRQNGTRSSTAGGALGSDGSNSTVPKRSPCTSCDGRSSGTAAARELGEQRPAGLGVQRGLALTEGGAVGAGEEVVAVVDQARALEACGGAVQAQGRGDHVVVARLDPAGDVVARGPAGHHPSAVARADRTGQAQAVDAGGAELLDRAGRPRGEHGVGHRAQHQRVAAPRRAGQVRARPRHRLAHPERRPDVLGRAVLEARVGAGTGLASGPAERAPGRGSDAAAPVAASSSGEGAVLCGGAAVTLRTLLASTERPPQPSPACRGLHHTL